MLDLLPLLEVEPPPLAKAPPLLAEPSSPLRAETIGPWLGYEGEYLRRWAYLHLTRYLPTSLPTADLSDAASSSRASSRGCSRDFSFLHGTITSGPLKLDAGDGGHSVEGRSGGREGGGAVNS